jgi:hypothetical protein
MCSSRPCLGIPSLCRWLQFSCSQYCWPHLRGQFIRAADLDQLLEIGCSNEAEFKRAVSIKLSAAWEFQ